MRSVANYFPLLVFSLLAVLAKAPSQPDAQSYITSDERLKTDIKPLENVLDGIDGLRAVSYAYKDQKLTGTKLNLPEGTHYGMIAQDLKAHFPHAVFEADGFFHIKERELSGILLGAIKELRDENARVKDVLNNQHMDIAQLTEQVEHLSQTAEISELQESMSAVEHYIREQRTPTVGD